MTTITTASGHAQKPVPLSDSVTVHFWEAARRHELVMQHCQSCMRYIYPPTLTCSSCQSDDIVFENVSGRGEVYSFTVMRLALHAGFVEEVPFVLCAVRLEESDDLLIISNIVGIPIDDVHIGMPVIVDFEERPDATVPVFRAA